MKIKNKFLIDNPKFPYCAGCGHTLIIKALDKALQKINIIPEKINIITDIGCVGLSDKLFLTNTIHTTHGRSTAIAEGVSLAEEILFNKDSINVVLIGDGGATIGLTHLIEAARLNVNITVILHNNFLYGMTGGQHSGLTPKKFKTTTTVDGNIISPLKILDILKLSNAGFLARKLATDTDLSNTLAEAINHKGFSLVEIIELCTGYATKLNKMTKDDIKKILESSGSNDLGIIFQDKNKDTFSKIYKDTFSKKKIETDLANNIKVKEIDTPIKNLNIITAGTAGEGVQFASRLFMETAISCGFNGVQKNDNPVTVGSGFSISEIKLSKDEILFSGFSKPDFVIITSAEGVKKIFGLIKTLDRYTTLIVDESVKIPKTKAKVFIKPINKNAGNKNLKTITAFGYLFNLLDSIPVKNFEKTIKNSKRNTENTINALRCGFNL